VLRRAADQHRDLIQHLNEQHGEVIAALAMVRDLLSKQHGEVMDQFGGLRRDVADVQATADKILEAAQTSTATGDRTTFDAAVANFIGRDDQINLIKQPLRAAQDGGTPICGIFGMRSLGKTELARKATDQIEDAFPGARLLLELRGTTSPMTPQEALTVCITEFGGQVQQQQTVDELRRLYLRTLNGKRALVIADNARDKVHVDYINAATRLCACDH
jgi:hypothetical protein